MCKTNCDSILPVMASHREVMSELSESLRCVIAKSPVGLRQVVTG